MKKIKTKYGELTIAEAYKKFNVKIPFNVFFRRVERYSLDKALSKPYKKYKTKERLFLSNGIEVRNDVMGKQVSRPDYW